MIRRTDAVKRTVTFGYDEFGNLAQVKETDGGVYRLEYNAAHLRIAQTEPDGNRWQWKYDDRNRLIAFENPARAIVWNVGVPALAWRRRIFDIEREWGMAPLPRCART